MSVAKKKVLICGATGFIGRNILEKLVQNSSYQVTATYHRKKPFSIRHRGNLKWIKADLTNFRDVRALVPGAEIVIQAAATTSGAKEIVTRPYYHVTDNAVMNSLIFRACHEFAVNRGIQFRVA